MMYSAKLKIKCMKPRYCRSLYDSMHPDNIFTGKKISIKEFIYEDQYIIEITVNNRKPGDFDSLRGTLDEILSIVSMIDKTQAILK